MAPKDKMKTSCSATATTWSLAASMMLASFAMMPVTSFIQPTAWTFDHKPSARGNDKCGNDIYGVPRATRISTRELQPSHHDMSRLLATSVDIAVEQEQQHSEEQQVARPPLPPKDETFSFRGRIRALRLSTRRDKYDTIGKGTGGIWRSSIAGFMPSTVSSTEIVEWSETTVGNFV